MYKWKKERKLESFFVSLLLGLVGGQGAAWYVTSAGCRQAVASWLRHRQIMRQRWCPNCPGPSASLKGGEGWGGLWERRKEGGGGFPAHMQMRHGTNYLIGMKWVGARFHSSRITLIVLTLSKYKACAMPWHSIPTDQWLSMQEEHRQGTREREMWRTTSKQVKLSDKQILFRHIVLKKKN